MTKTADPPSAAERYPVTDPLLRPNDPGIAQQLVCRNDGVLGAGELPPLFLGQRFGIFTFGPQFNDLGARVPSLCD